MKGLMVMFSSPNQMLRRRQRSTPDFYMPEWPAWVYALLTVIALCAVGVGVYFGIQSDQHYDVGMRMFHQRWDSKAKRPDSLLLSQGESGAVPIATVSPSEYWQHCLRTACENLDIGHYPVALPLWTMAADDSGCYVFHPGNRVKQLNVAMMKGGTGAFKATFSSGGNSLRVCGPQSNIRSDTLAIWSDAPGAAQ